MATITRGYNFSPIEQVTSRKLDELIRNADINSLSWSEVNSSFPLVIVGSAPSGAAVGTLGCVYEPPYLDNSSYSGIWSEYNIMIETGRGPVALAKQNGLETRRFVAAHGGLAATFRPGGAACIATATGGVTLTFNQETGSAAFGNAHCLGPIHSEATSITSPTDPRGIPRLVLRGYAGIFSDGAPGNSIPPPNFVVCDNHVTEIFGATNSTSMDKILGACLSNIGSTGRRPAFMFGSPIWRL